MSGEHDWEKTDGPRERVKMSLVYDNVWTCRRCGAKSGNLASKPSPRSRVSRDGYVGNGYMGCDEWVVARTMRS